MLPKKYRLSSKEFQNVYEDGVKVKGHFGMVIALSSAKLETPKFGFVVNSKIGNAVQRHQVLRRLRIVAMELTKNYPLSPALYEYVCFKRPDSWDVFKEETMDLFQKASAKVNS